MVEHMQDRSKNYKLVKAGRKFYSLAVFIFAALIAVTIFTCITDGVTDERIVIILLNSWFILFTMDLIVARFRRDGERAFWHNWVFFSRRNKKQSQDTKVENQKNDDTTEFLQPVNQVIDNVVEKDNTLDYSTINKNNQPPSDLKRTA